MAQHRAAPLQEPAVILLVEDNEGDAYLARECLKNARHDIVIHHVENGEQCLEYLRKEGRFADSPTPTLILLDLHMPRMDGRQVMEALRADGNLRHVTVLVLTTSTSTEDIGDLYSLGCRAYLTKPDDLGEFQRKINDLCNFWLGTAELPPSSRHQ